MIKHFTNFIITRTTVKNTAIFVSAVIILEIIFSMLLPVFIEATGGTILDMSVKYTPEFAYERITSIDKAAGVYFKIRVLDFIFPVCYAFALTFLSSIVYRRKYKEADNYRWILITPFMAAVFDYIENILLIIMQQSLPIQYYFAAKVLNIVSILKFCFIGLSIFLIITGALALLKGSDSMLILGNTFKGKKKD